MKKIFWIVLAMQLVACDNRGKTKTMKSETVAMKNVTAVFMGNSITASWAKMDPVFFLNNNYVGRGISGQTTGEMLARFEKDVIDLHPAVVVILGGINDIAENNGPVSTEKIFENIVSMTTLATNNKIKVVLCAVLPAHDIPWRPSVKPIEKVISLNNIIMQYCSENNIPYVNFYTAMVDENYGLRKELTQDGLHPTLPGYKIMEPLVVTAIKEAGVTK